VKAALLLSGLFADEPTFVREGIASPDHAERMLDALDVPIEAAGPIVRLDVNDWSGKLRAFATDVPGDVFGAAILLAAATLVPASRVCVRGTGLNVTRRGTLDAIRQMGGAIAWEVHRTALGEPEGVVCANHAPLVGIGFSGENLVRARGELHLVAALAARARGRTEMAGIGALLGPVAESALGPLIELVRAFGVDAETAGDGLVIEGRPEGPLIAADVEAGEPGLAVTATLLGLAAGGSSRVRNVDALARRFPRFAGTLRALGVDARIEERTV
jgi:3-phosphoshikimate 1-carboxyvinyltransferase